MKLLIAGSRDFNDYEMLKEKLDKILCSSNISEIISGKAKGADTLGERYAKERNIKIKEFPAEWNLYGKKAGMIRNKEMAKYATNAIIFWDGNSKGTENMIKLMEKLKKPFDIIFYKDNLEDELCEW